jgi:hypothetical protein
MRSPRLASLPRIGGRQKLSTAAARATDPKHATKHNKASLKKALHLRLWEVYQNSLDKSPLLTKAVMASFIFFASDSATQYVLPGKQNLVPTSDDDENSSNNENNNENNRSPVGWRWDAARALSGAGFGVVATSWLHYWWGFLEAGVGRMLPVARHRLANTMVKVVADQLIGT